MKRLWDWICSWFKSRPEHLPPPQKVDFSHVTMKEHWRDIHPHNLKIRTKPLMESGEAYRYTRDDKGQIRRKPPKGGKR